MLLYIVFFIFTQFTATSNPIVFYSNNLASYTGADFASISGTDDLCRTIQETDFNYISCSSTIPFLNYASRLIANLDTTYGFSPTINVIGPTGVLIGTWNDVVSGTLTNSMFDALVIDSTINTFWTGSSTTGTLPPTIPNCLDWTSSNNFDNGRTGSSTTLTSNWKSISSTGCDNTRRFICICISTTEAPTLNPTKKPTADPTKNPTKKPTQNPTKNPTRHPTKNPTKNPTSNPTRNPTKDPTKNPTTSKPTANPTQSPTISDVFGEVVFMAARGSQAQIQRIAGANVSYSVIDGEVNFPLNVTVKPGSNLVPIKWSNVMYRVFNPSSNLTTTETITECNPVANRVQGTTPTGFNGLKTCPSIRKCENCTVNLSPSGVTWSNLRACICTYTVTIREDIADLLAGGTYQLQTIKLSATVPNPQVISDEQFIVGELQCNSFIDRELNCQFPRYIPNYAPQCQSQPISCFNFTLGYAFGGFWDQNPKFQYNIPRANWTQAHYHGIATVLNNKTYSKNTFYIDPMVPSTFTNYFWFTNISSLDVLTRAGSRFFYVLIPEISQAEPYSYISGDLPPPETTIDSSFITGDLAVCYLSLKFGGIPSPACNNQNWEGISKFNWRLPGYWEYVTVEATEVIYSVDITANFNFSGVEVYTPRGNLCGKIIQPLIGKTVTISCANAFNNTSPIDGGLYIRYFGVSNFWDIPGAQLASSLPVLYDALVEWGVVSSLYSQQQFINLVFGTIYAFYIEGVYGTDITTQFPHKNTDFGDYVEKPTYVIRYGIISDTQDELTSQRDALFSQILNNNTYPRNYALETRVLAQGYDSSPVNFSSPDDLDYLYRFWGTWLAPRRCSEEVECRTFNLGKCVFPQTGGPKQFWYNGDEFPDYDIPAGVKEGGCKVYNSWEQGYYSPQFFGANCKEGYGPLTLTQWLKILQYNTTISQTLPSSAPFNLTFTPETFESELACKFPVGKDPLTSPFVDFNMCGGHGEVSFSTITGTEALIPFFAFKQYWLTFECTELLYNEEYYTLNTTQTIFALQYVSGSGDIITIINDSIYLNGEGCIFFRSQSLPAKGTLQCGSSRKTLSCINPLYFTTYSRSFSFGVVTQWQNWILYFV